MFHYGIRGLPLKLFASYLENRKQCVRIGNFTSEFATLNIGLPQGSVLGPILYLIYANDLPQATENLSSVLYADDTTLLASSHDARELIQNFNLELAKIYTWTCKNRISINTSKTFAMLFTNRNVTPSSLDHISINSEIIDVVETGKFLGLKLDNKLTFSFHLKDISVKLSKTVGIFYKLQPDVPRNNLISLYYSLFYPYILYCILIWGGSYNTHLKPIELLQKKIVRIIIGAHFLAHTNPLFIDLKILKLKDVFRLVVCNYVYQHKHEFVSHASHHHETRNRLNLNPDFQRLTQTQRSIKCIGPKLWNEVPLYIQNARNFNQFKSQLKKYYLMSYHDEPISHD